MGILFLVLGRKVIRNTPLQKTRLTTFVLTQLMRKIGRSNTNNGSTFVQFRGATFQMEAEDISILPSVLTGDYESKELDLIEGKIQSYVKQNGCLTIIDVGANVGLYSIILGRHLRLSDTLILIEPDPRNIQLLNLNIEKAKLATQIKIQEVAVSSSNGPIDLVLSKYGGLSHISKGDELNTIRVNTVALDSVFEKIPLGTRVFCKVDVEGFEFDVLNSGINSVINFKPDLLIEFGQVKDLTIAEKWGDTLEILFENYSERLYFIDNRIIQVDYKEFLGLATMAKLGNLWLSSKHG